MAFRSRISSISKASVVIYIVALYFGNPLYADPLQDYQQLSAAGYLVVDENNQVVASSHAADPFIPASTVKLITAWLCLEHWGEQYRHRTHFYFDPSNRRLWVKAGGDPFLVSEEMQLIAAHLATLSIGEISSIGLDTHLFKADLIVPGATTTNNPYDAIPSSLAANFNTVNIERRGGKVVSAEAQTPLTATAQALGQSLQGVGAVRMNTGQSSQVAEKYFAELLAEFLRQQSVVVSDTVVWGAVPDLKVLYVHENTRTLGEVVQGMLKYSTNFIANQLILTLVAERTGKPADFAAVSRFLKQLLESELGWRGSNLVEGAGLSPDNRLSAHQLTQLLSRFSRWQQLLPEIEPGLMAKTGTLNNVKTLAGFVVDKNNKPLRFAILVNESVAADFPTKMIQALVNR